MPATDEARLLGAAKARLDRLDFYPRPIDVSHVHLVSAPWVFRLPWFSRFVGYTCFGLILLKMPVREASEDLIVHELTHVWQHQHRWVRLWISYLYLGYRANPYEVEAREAVRLTAP